MMNDLIVIKQLPIIQEQLKQLSAEIDKKVENTKKLVCTEETVKEIKKVRADLNKEFKDLEIQRKLVKEQILAPYMKFEEVYKQYVSDKYKGADVELKNKVDTIENGLKIKKEQDVKEYFEEYKIANNIDFITYEQLKINVTLTASMKSLKDQVKNFIDKIVTDLILIESQEHKTEILIEYKQTLNLSNAIIKVNNRFKAIEEENKKQEQKLQQFVEKEVLKSPEIVEEKEYTLKFTVKATKIKLQELKKFLNNGGYIYE